MTPDPGSPSTTPTNPVDLTETDTVKNKITEQATARLDLVKFLINEQRELAAVDVYVKKLDHAQLQFEELEGALNTKLMEEERRAGYKTRYKNAWSNWRGTLNEEHLPATFKDFPVPQDGVELKKAATFAHSYQKDGWGRFKKLFKVFLTGPVEMSAVRFPDAQTWLDYTAALKYAQETGRITIPAGLLSFQP